MKKLIYLLLVLFFAFSCKKAEVRKGIEGEWILKSMETSWNDRNDFIGTGIAVWDFGSCSNKMNRKETCIMTKYNYEHFYKIVKGGKKVIIDETTYNVDINWDNMVLFEGTSSKIGTTYTFIRN